MPPVVLGLDIGGANLKAATADKRAASLPFPLWREPDGLARKLAELLAHFPDAEEFAVTMTGELCDCYETKREGVNRILTAVQQVARSYPIRVWGTDGEFMGVEKARNDYLKVAAANWHALATYAGRFASHRAALLIDIGSTTTDLIPIFDKIPHTRGRTDRERLEHSELVYFGVRRTPICALVGYSTVAAEFFASTQDACVVLGHLPEEPTNTETADGRPLTKAYSHARLSRMLCSDPELTSWLETENFAKRVIDRMVDVLHPKVMSHLIVLKNSQYWQQLIDTTLPVTVILSGSGEFLTRFVCDPDANGSLAFLIQETVSLNERLGTVVSACAPAYALAVHATERRP